MKTEFPFNPTDEDDNDSDATYPDTTLNTEGDEVATVAAAPTTIPEAEQDSSLADMRADGMIQKTGFLLNCDMSNPLDILATIALERERNPYGHIWIEERFPNPNKDKTVTMEMSQIPYSLSQSLIITRPEHVPMLQRTGNNTLFGTENQIKPSRNQEDVMDGFAFSTGNPTHACRNGAQIAKGDIILSKAIARIIFGPVPDFGKRLTASNYSNEARDRSFATYTCENLPIAGIEAEAEPFDATNSTNIAFNASFSTLNQTANYPPPMTGRAAITHAEANRPREGPCLPEDNHSAVFPNTTNHCINRPFVKGINPVTFLFGDESRAHTMNAEAADLSVLAMGTPQQYFLPVDERSKYNDYGVEVMACTDRTRVKDPNVIWMKSALNHARFWFYYKTFIHEKLCLYLRTVMQHGKWQIQVFRKGPYEDLRKNYIIIQVLIAALDDSPVGRLPEELVAKMHELLETEEGGWKGERIYAEVCRIN